MSSSRFRWIMRALLLIVTASAVAGLLASPQAFADATDEYPIPSKQIETLCDAEQYLAAARDTSPIYFERYMLDKSNRPLDVQQAAEDRIHWFYSLDAAGRRQYSEDTATNIYYEQVATRWGNWAGEAIQAGCLFLGRADSLAMPGILLPALVANTTDEAWARAESLLEKPEEMDLLLRLQASLADYLCFQRPLAELTRRARVFFQR